MRTFRLSSNCTHTHTLAFTHAHSYFCTLSHSSSLTHSHTHTHTHSHTLFLLRNQMIDANSILSFCCFIFIGCTEPFLFLSFSFFSHYVHLCTTFLLHTSTPCKSTYSLFLSVSLYLFPSFPLSLYLVPSFPLPLS